MEGFLFFWTNFQTVMSLFRIGLKIKQTFKKRLIYLDLLNKIAPPTELE